MDGHKTTEGQLQPLAVRTGTAAKQARRAARNDQRLQTRQIGAMAMGRANMALSVLGRGLSGRLKWLLLGR